MTLSTRFFLSTSLDYRSMTGSLQNLSWSRSWSLVGTGSPVGLGINKSDKHFYESKEGWGTKVREELYCNEKASFCLWWPGKTRRNTERNRLSYTSLTSSWSRFDSGVLRSIEEERESLRTVVVYFFGSGRMTSYSLFYLVGIWSGYRGRSRVYTFLFRCSRFDLVSTGLYILLRVGTGLLLWVNWVFYHSLLLTNIKFLEFKSPLNNV